MKKSEVQNPQFSNIQDVEWSESTITNSVKCHNKHSIGKHSHHVIEQFFKKQIFNIEITQETFQRRKEELEKIKHQNSMQMLIKADFQTVKHISFVKKISVISPYFQSINLTKVIKEKTELPRRKIINILFQIINIMSYAQKLGIIHGRINPNAILLKLQKQTQQNKEIKQFNLKDTLLKITDWGFGNEAFKLKNFNKKLYYEKYYSYLQQSSEFQYYHPEILFVSNNEESLRKIKQSSKLDIWSVGIILYKLKYFHHPFCTSSQFDPSKLKIFYNQSQKLFLKEESLENSIIEMMLNPKEVNSWIQLKELFIQKLEYSQIDFKGISNIFQQHYALMAYLIEIYKLTLWNMNNSPNCFWLENRTVMRKFVVQLLKLMHLFHDQKFPERFGFRVSELNQEEKRKFLKLSNMIKVEWEHLTQGTLDQLKNQIFFQRLDKFRQYLLKVQISMKDYETTQSQKLVANRKIVIKECWRSMKKINQFCCSMTQAITSIGDRNKNIFIQFFALSYL